MSVIARARSEEHAACHNCFCQREGVPDRRRICHCCWAYTTHSKSLKCLISASVLKSPAEGASQLGAVVESIWPGPQSAVRQQRAWPIADKRKQIMASRISPPSENDRSRSSTEEIPANVRAPPCIVLRTYPPAPAPSRGQVQRAAKARGGVAGPLRNRLLSWHTQSNVPERNRHWPNKLPNTLNRKLYRPC